jgi:serine/threonine protein kinase
MEQAPRQPPDELPAPFGRYRLTKLLGKGGMGSVYLAHDSQLDRSVALKIPLLDAGGSAVLTRFETEARAAAALHHPNICPIHDVGEIDGLPYLTMAYIEGKPLKDFARIRPLLPRQSAALVRKLALALSEAHKHNIIHRDLKPANIMIDNRGEPVIMDFGLARRVQSADIRVTQQGVAMGTPAYMPPEQVQGDLKAMGPASDIYSLGVILYELLTGRLPFSGDMMVMLSQVLLDEPPPPSRFRPELERELEAICLKALAKKVEDRHSSMAVLAGALAGYLRNKTATLEQAPPAVTKPVSPVDVETEASGIRISQMGGFRSVANLHADLQRSRKVEDETKKSKTAVSRAKKTRKKKRSRLLAFAENSPWLMVTIFASIVGLSVGLALWLKGRGSSSASTGGSVTPAHAGTGRNPEVTGAGSSPLPPPITTSEKKVFKPPEQKTVGKEPVAPQPPEPKKTETPPAGTSQLLDEFMLKYLTKIGCSAAALAVDQNGVPLHVRAYGGSAKKRARPVTAETMFPIGVGTGPLLAAAIRQLEEKKQLRLNDSLLKRLQIKPLGRVVDARVWNITIEHVLQGKTGWDNDLVQLVRKAIRARKFKGPIPVEVVLAGLATQPLREAPGTRDLGCAFHFQVLTHLITKFSGRSPGAYFRYELLGKELPGIAASGSPEALPTSVRNAASEPVCASAPALLEVMRHFGVNGMKGRRLGSWSWYNANFTCQLTWRGDGINAVVLFNGCRDGSTHDEIGAELRKLLDTMKAGAP